MTTTFFFIFSLLSLPTLTFAAHNPNQTSMSALAEVLKEIKQESDRKEHSKSIVSKAHPAHTPSKLNLTANQTPSRSKSELLKTTGSKSQALSDSKPALSHGPGECNNELLNSYMPSSYIESQKPQKPSDEMDFFCPNVKSSCCSDYQLRYLMHRYMSGKLLLLKVKISLEDLFAVFTTINKSQIMSLFEMNKFCFKEKTFTELDQVVMSLKSANIKSLTDQYFQKKLNFFKGFVCTMCSERQSVFFDVVKKKDFEIQSQATISTDMCYDYISEHSQYLKIKQLIGQMRVLLGSIECAVDNMDFDQNHELRKIFFQSHGRLLTGKNGSALSSTSEDSSADQFQKVSLKGHFRKRSRDHDQSSEFSIQSLYNKTLSDLGGHAKSYKTESVHEHNFIQVSSVSDQPKTNLSFDEKDFDQDDFKHLAIPSSFDKTLLIETQSDSEDLFFNKNTTNRIQEKIKRIEMNKNKQNDSKLIEETSLESMSSESKSDFLSNHTKIIELLSPDNRGPVQINKKFAEDEFYKSNDPKNTSSFMKENFVAPGTEDEEEDSILSEESETQDFYFKKQVYDQEKESKMRFIAQLMNKKIDTQTRKAISNLETRDQIKKFLKACTLLRQRPRDGLDFEERILETNCTSFCRKNISLTKLRLSKTFLREISNSYKIMSRILGNSDDDIEKNKPKNNFVLKRVFQGNAHKSFVSLKENFMGLGVDFEKIGLNSKKGKIIQFYNYNQKGVYDFDQFYLINVRSDMGLNFYRLDLGNFGLFNGVGAFGVQLVVFLLMWSWLN